MRCMATRSTTNGLRSSGRRSLPTSTSIRSRYVRWSAAGLCARLPHRSCRDQQRRSEGDTMRSAEHMGDELLSRLLDYLTARRAFEVAVDQARRQGWPDEEIYRVTGLSPHSAEAVLSRRQ